MTVPGLLVGELFELNLRSASLLLVGDIVRQQRIEWPRSSGEMSTNAVSDRVGRHT